MIAAQSRPVGAAPQGAWRGLEGRSLERAPGGHWRAARAHAVVVPPAYPVITTGSGSHGLQDVRAGDEALRARPFPRKPPAAVRFGASGRNPTQWPPGREPRAAAEPKQPGAPPGERRPGRQANQDADRPDGLGPAPAPTRRSDPEGDPHAVERPEPTPVVGAPQVAGQGVAGVPRPQPLREPSASQGHRAQEDAAAPSTSRAAGFFHPLGVPPASRPEPGGETTASRRPRWPRLVAFGSSAARAPLGSPAARHPGFPSAQSLLQSLLFR